MGSYGSFHKFGHFIFVILFTMSQKSSPKFSSSLGFLAAASGAAIGLANIWKFPYEVGSHGGAWYLIMYSFFIN